MIRSHGRRRCARRGLVASLAGVLAALAAGSAAGPAVAAGHGPEVIPLPPGFQPEGIASGRGDDLFVGSIPTGRIARVDARTGDTEVLVEQREGRAAIGLDYRRGLVFAAGGPTGRAFVYDATDGDDVASVRLTRMPAFVNDVAVTRRNAWFTDSQNPRLYRLALDRRGRPRGGGAALRITGDLAYDDDPGTFEANGIAAARGGRVLLVVQSRTGKLFRVDPDTGVSREVPLSGGPGDIVNADGILLTGRTLHVVQNRLNRIAVIRLSRDLTTGSIKALLFDEDFDVPTTIARQDGELYAVNARFGTPPEPTTDYSVVKVDAAALAAR